MTTTIEQHEDQNRPVSYFAMAAAIVAITILIRLATNFVHATSPGTDAAYYPMQVQWLIKHGKLNIPAMPLTFWIQALIAKIIMATSDYSLQESAALAARLFDGLIPPLAAIPVMMLGRRFANGRSSAIWLCAAATLLTVLSPPIFRMAGDLQKNAFGMVWMAVSILAMREALERPRDQRSWIFLAIAFVLSGLTHIAAFGLTLVILFGCFVGFIFTNKSREDESERAFPAVAVAIVTMLLLALIAMVAPSQFFRVGKLLKGAIVFEPRLLIGTLITYAVLAVVLVRLFRKQDLTARSDKALAIGLSLGIAFSFAPMFSDAVAMRFQLMCVLPGALLLMLYVIASRWDQRPGFRQKLLLYGSIVLAIAAPFAAQGPLLSEAAADELAQIGEMIEEPESTLVVAAHGLEFWAGHLMNTRVSNSSLPEDTSSYRHILFLKATEANRGSDRHDQHRRPPPGHGRRGPGDRTQLSIPYSARTIFRGEFFTLYRY